MQLGEERVYFTLQFSDYSSLPTKVRAGPQGGNLEAGI